MHVLWKYGRRACEAPACLRCTLVGRRPPQLWRHTGLLDRCSRSVDAFVSPSRFTARMHAERGFGRPLGLMPYFIDRVDSDWERPAPRPQAEPYFLFVGRLERIKGLQTLIDLWPRAPAVDLMVAGGGGEEAALRAQAAGNPRIRFLGPRSQRELGALYAHALATIIPSITYEVFPMVTLESFARKTPIVVRDLGGMPEAVEASGGGFVYRSDEELIEALERLAASPELRETLGERGYQAFLQRWTREAHLRQYFELLERLASEKYGAVPWAEAAEVGG
jgi:glycosyltransferase involved in cell wall biosynthesis